MPMLELQAVSKTYRRGAAPIPALREVSLRLERGELVGVHGPSGCGKTTLLLIAGGLLAPDAGTVRVADQDLRGLTPEPRARFRAATIGFVFQQFHLVPYLSVWENVLAAAMATPVPEARARAERLLAGLNLAARRDHLPAELSTGERQRAAVARALLVNPRLVLADEPTGNLDEDNARMVLQALAEHAAGGGAVLVASHDRRVLAQAGRTFAMADGALAENRQPNAPVPT